MLQQNERDISNNFDAIHADRDQKFEVMIHRELDHSPTGFISSCASAACAVTHFPAPGNYIVGQIMAVRLRSGVYYFLLQEPDGPFRSLEGLRGLRGQRVYERRTDVTGARAAARIRSLYNHYRGRKSRLMQVRLVVQVQKAACRFSNITMDPDKHSVVMALLRKLSRGECFSSKVLNVRWVASVGYDKSFLATLLGMEAGLRRQRLPTFHYYSWPSLASFSSIHLPTPLIPRGGVQVMRVLPVLVKPTLVDVLQILQPLPSQKSFGSRCG